MKLTTPLTIHYDECAFTFPWNDNRQNIHRTVYDTILDGKDITEDRKTRVFLYDAIALDAHAELGLVTVRGARLPEHLKAASNSLTIKPGDELEISATLSASRKRFMDQRNYTQRVTDEDVPEWAKAMLERNASVSASDITLISRNDYRVKKPTISFIVPLVKIRATVIVEDSAAFALIFLNGLGAQKGYGAGMIEVIRDAKNTVQADSV